jgi:tetratricopeptide (TPR) repeat protein
VTSATPHEPGKFSANGADGDVGGGGDGRDGRSGRDRVEPQAPRWNDWQWGEDDDRGGRWADETARRIRWRGWGIGVMALISVALLLLLLRQPLSNWLWPDTRAQQLQADAASALRQGQLTSADGRGARELYAAALALDPDRSEARQGMAKVGQQALVQAERALEKRDYAQAHRSIALARELAVPQARVDALEQRVREREAGDSGVDKLLAQAAAARKAGLLDGGDNAALPLYQRVLALEPKRTEALEGREDTLADLLQQAQTSLARGELAEASARIRRVQAADPGHVDLPDALAGLNRAAEQHRAKADADLRRGRLDEAVEGYRAVLAAMPDDERAQHGIAAVANAYAGRSQRYAGDFRFNEAEKELAQARRIDASAPGVAAAEQRLVQARQSQQRYGKKVPTAERQRRLDQLLADAAQAESRGNLLTPPGDSAFDKLRAAQSMAPQDPAVRSAMARLLPAAQRCFESELRGNRLSRARECLDARAVLEGDGPAVRDARRRLAQRWIAVGDERLGAGELGAAQAALVAARELDPQASGLGEFADRLRRASAAN